MDRDSKIALINTFLMSDVTLMMELAKELKNICDNVHIWPDFQFIEEVNNVVNNAQAGTHNVLKHRWISDAVVVNEQPNSKEYANRLAQIMNTIMQYANLNNIVCDGTCETIKHPDCQTDTLKMLYDIMSDIVKKIKDKNPQYDDKRLNSFMQQIYDIIDQHYFNASGEDFKDVNSVQTPTIKTKTKKRNKQNKQISKNVKQEQQNNLNTINFSNSMNNKELPEEYKEATTLQEIIKRINDIIKTIPEKDHKKQNSWGISYYYCKELDNYTYMEKVYENLQNILKTHNIDIKNITSKRRDTINDFNRLWKAVKKSRTEEDFDKMSIDTRQFYKDNKINPYTYNIDFSDLKGNAKEYSEYKQEEINNDIETKSLDSQEEEEKKI